MAKTLRIAGLAGSLLLILLSSSCRNSAPAARVLAGNMSFGRGQYQKAILQYLEADDDVELGRDAVLYNLANVYYALGEGDAALRSWSMAEELTEDVDVLFRIAFNRGVLYYNWGRYDEAYRSFRRALVLRPSDVDAKINLEDSLSRIRTAGPQNAAGENQSVNGDDEEGRRLLDYIKRKEADTWTGQADDSDERPRDW